METLCPEVSAAADDGAAPEAPRRLASDELSRGAKSGVIEHDGVEYTLPLTRQNKLLLTK